MADINLQKPKICVPIVDGTTEEILMNAKSLAGMGIDMIEWRIDFYQNLNDCQAVLDLTKQLKEIFDKEELLVTFRTIYEGGENVDERISYKDTIYALLNQGVADYVDMEVEQCKTFAKEFLETARKNGVKTIGSYHNFQLTPSKEELTKRLTVAKETGYEIGKAALMPQTEEDVDRILAVTQEMSKNYKVITMAMSGLGKRSRIYGGLYGSLVTFSCIGKASAPGQVGFDEMTKIFEGLYSGKRHIVLIGFMGTGKTTISRKLAFLTGRKEWDTDAMIVKNEGREISEIFACEGEDYFRQVETDLIDVFGNRDAGIISCGGGMAMRDLNVKKLSAIGTIFLLEATPESVYERVKDSTNRPLLSGDMSVTHIKELMDVRRPAYEGAADYIIHTDNREISDIAQEISKKC